MSFEDFRRSHYTLTQRTKENLTTNLTNFLRNKTKQEGQTGLTRQRSKSFFLTRKTSNYARTKSKNRALPFVTRNVTQKAKSRGRKNETIGGDFDTDGQRTNVESYGIIRKNWKIPRIRQPANSKTVSRVISKKINSVFCIDPEYQTFYYKFVRFLKYDLKLKILKTENVKDKFLEIKNLGKGKHSMVMLLSHRKTKRLYAGKVFKNNRIRTVKTLKLLKVRDSASPNVFVYKCG